MPTYEFQCADGHVTEELFSVDTRPKEIVCQTCGDTAYRIISKTNVNASGLGVKGSSSVYWPNKGMAQGRVIENLTPRPVTVRDKGEYRKLLKETHSQEAG